MSPNIDNRRRTLRYVRLTMFFGLIADQAMAQSIQGTATYRERMAVPAGAVFEATIEDGCNQMSGSYELKGEAVTFGQMVGTQMACIDTGEIERGFRDALKSATRLTIAGDRLELFDVTGKRVAVFTAGSRASLPSTSPGLAGTAWQLVKFQGGDETTLTPDDGAKYTIQFGGGGRLTARIDCNRGRGTWKSSGSHQLQFSPLALTRAKCPAGSLHDQIVKQWGNIRSYVVKDGHLFLSLMADGGIYEFEPVIKAER
jgi:heat shock protein HslJ